MLPLRDIDAAAACALRESKSQWGEDLLLLPTLLHSLFASGRSKGVFLEMGALDGVTFSNTFMLERCFGWRGFLVEANPTNAEALRKSVRNATLIHSGVCRPAGAINMTVGGWHVAGQVGAMSAQHRAKWAKLNNSSGIVSVPCQPLADVLQNARNTFHLRERDDAHSLPPLPPLRPRWRTTEVGSIDFFSLDVEGAEEHVLLASEMETFRTVLVELDNSYPARDTRIRLLLEASGLHPVHNLSQISQSTFFTRARTKTVPVREPHVRLGRIARQYHRFRPTHSNMVSVLREVAATLPRANNFSFPPYVN